MVNIDIYNAEIANIEDIIDITDNPYENPNQIFIKFNTENNQG